MPQTSLSNKQTATSHSTPELEIIAADTAVKNVGLPALDMWDTLFGRKLSIQFMEDNESCIKIVKAGKSRAMRHIGRTHGADLSWLHEQFEKGSFDMRYCESTHQCADIFTKAFTNLEKWRLATANVQVVDPAQF